MEAAEETRRLRGFREMLRSEDKVIFDDLMRQCKLYASHASTMTSVVKEVPLIMPILFGQHKRLMELENRIKQHKEMWIYAEERTIQNNRRIHQNVSGGGSTHPGKNEADNTKSGP